MGRAEGGLKTLLASAVLPAAPPMQPEILAAVMARRGSAHFDNLFLRHMRAWLLLALGEEGKPLVLERPLRIAFESAARANRAGAEFAAQFAAEALDGRAIRWPSPASRRTVDQAKGSERALLCVLAAALATADRKSRAPLDARRQIGGAIALFDSGEIGPVSTDADTLQRLAALL